MKGLIKKIQVNIPFSMLYESYLGSFIEDGLNPEIGFHATALDKYTLSDFGRIADQLHKSGLTITFHAPFIDLSPGSLDPKIRAITQDRFEQILQLIPLFKPKTVICHTGYDEKRYGFIRDIWIENSLKMWSWLSKRVQNEGARLLLENVYEHNPDDILVLLENLGNKKAGFCLDIGHQAAFSRTPLETWLEVLGSYLDQLHLHDNFGKRDEHLAMGKGNIDFPLLFSRLFTIKRKPPIITLEPHSEQEFLPSLEYLEKIWPW